MKAEQLRRELLTVLTEAQGPVTTTQARLAVTRSPRVADSRPPVAEEVYRALVVLQRHGTVRRADDPARRGAMWEMAALFGDVPVLSRETQQQK